MTGRFYALRAAEYPWADHHTYLNHAGVGPLPARTRRVLEAWLDKRTDPSAITDDDLAETLRRARRAAARLVNADPEEIALATNTSYGLNLAAFGLPLEAGSVIVVPDREFPANMYPWLELEARGVRVERVPLTRDGAPDEDRLLEAVRRPEVRVLAISFVQFHNGCRADLDRLGAACRAEHTFLVVDAIQGLGQLPLDVRRTPIDVLSCGGQKWLLAPWGSGFVYVRRELQDRMRPPLAGWMAFEGTDDFSRLTAYDRTRHPDGRRFELVTLPFQDLAGFSTSVEMLTDLGVGNIAAHLAALRRPFDEAAERGTLRVVSPAGAEHRSGILCFATDDTERTYQRLRAAGVTCAYREGAVRVAPHFYNTLDEMARVVTIAEAR